MKAIYVISLALFFFACKNEPTAKVQPDSNIKHEEISDTSEPPRQEISCTFGLSSEERYKRVNQFLNACNKQFMDSLCASIKAKYHLPNVSYSYMGAAVSNPGIDVSDKFHYRFEKNYFDSLYTRNDSIIKDIVNSIHNRSPLCDKVKLDFKDAANKHITFWRALDTIFPIEGTAPFAKIATIRRQCQPICAYLKEQFKGYGDVNITTIDAAEDGQHQWIAFFDIPVNIESAYEHKNYLNKKYIELLPRVISGLHNIDSNFKDVEFYYVGKDGHLMN